MDLKKTILFILVINFFLLILLGLVSLRFLTQEIEKSQAVAPEIMAQYEIKINVDQFDKLVKQLKKYSNP